MDYPMARGRLAQLRSVHHQPDDVGPVQKLKPVVPVLVDERLRPFSRKVGKQEIDLFPFSTPQSQMKETRHSVVGQFGMLRELLRRIVVVPVEGALAYLVERHNRRASG